MVQMKKVRSYLSDLPRIIHHVGDTLGALVSGPSALSLCCVHARYSQMCVLGTVSGLGHLLEWGSPTPGPRTTIGPWPVRNQATQQEVSGG